MKIFLVEDEIYTLRAMEQKILDLDNGWEIIGTAFNGSEALEKLTGLQPDIIITDIRMPDMDGLRFLEILKERDMQVVTVIVSGFQEFEYAKQAIRLGVEDYLLKPVQIRELETCLEKCRDKLQKMRSQRDSISLQLTQEYACYYIAYVIVSNPLSETAYLVHPDVDEDTISHLDIIFAGCLPPTIEYACSGGISANEKVLLLGGDIKERNLKSWLDAAATQIHTQTGHYITIQYASFSDIKKVSLTIFQCRRSAVHNVRLGEDIVSCAVPVFPKQNYDMKERILMLAHLLRGGETQILNRRIFQMLQEWEQVKLPIISIQRTLVFLLNSLKTNFEIVEETDMDSMFCVENIISFSNNYEELAESYGVLLRELFSSKESAKSMEGEEIVQQIIDYYERNLSENITLQILSEKINKSKVYLCKIFKQHKNMTPIDYFTHMKINKAKEMLFQYPNMPLREISDYLGFSDMYYFSKVFKRITGQPPSELRTKNVP